MRVLRKENRSTEILAYMPLVRPILEYGSVSWDPCREQINALHRVQKKAAQFTNHTKVSNWQTLAQRRTIERLCALFKAYYGKRAWKAISDRVRRDYCLCRVHRVRKIRDRKQRMDIRKYSFVNTTIKNWNQLPAETLGTFPCKHKIFRKQLQTGRNEGIEVWRKSSKSAVK